MSELDLEAVRRKAQNAVTATDKEWARIVLALLNKVEELEDDVERMWDDYRIGYTD